MIEKNKEKPQKKWGLKWEDEFGLADLILKTMRENLCLSVMGLNKSPNFLNKNNFHFEGFLQRFFCVFWNNLMGSRFLKSKL